MNYSAIHDGYGQWTRNRSQERSTQYTFPAAPFPRKYIHSVIDDLQQAEQAMHALEAAGYEARDIHLIASQQFVAAVEQRLQRMRRLQCNQEGACLPCPCEVRLFLRRSHPPISLASYLHLSLGFSKHSGYCNATLHQGGAFSPIRVKFALG